MGKDMFINENTQVFIASQLNEILVFHQKHKKMVEHRQNFVYIQCSDEWEIAEVRSR
jgi:hypothetical protein